MFKFLKSMLVVFTFYAAFHSIMLSITTNDSDRLAQLPQAPQVMTMSELIRSDWKSQPRITLTHIRVGKESIREFDENRRYWLGTYFLVYDNNTAESGHTTMMLVNTRVCKEQEVADYSNQSEITGIVKGRIATQFLSSVRTELEKLLPGVDVSNMLLIDGRPLPTQADIQGQRRTAMVLGILSGLSFFILLICSKSGRALILLPYFVSRAIINNYVQQRSKKTAK